MADEKAKEVAEKEEETLTNEEVKVKADHEGYTFMVTY